MNQFVIPKVAIEAIVFTKFVSDIFRLFKTLIDDTQYLKHLQIYEGKT
jgi:hypothetical protein